jgi:N-acetylglucosaminyl-diphospho-decaprenol L-rhamnosyltransferase
LNFPDTKIIACNTNLGFAAANNLAETHAKGQKLLLLNPDTIVLGRAIDELYEFALANPGCRIWGGRSIHPDGSFDWSCKRKMTLWNVFCSATGLSFLFNHPEEYRRWNHDTVREVDYLSGGFLLIDRDLWKELGGFDASFFMYGEDQDLCLRAHRLGAHPTFTPVATVVHYGAASEHDESEKHIKAMAGDVTIMKRHWSTIGASFGRLLYLILPHPRWLVYGLLGAITRRSRLRQKAATWWRVWQCRGRWIDGWPPRERISISSTNYSGPCAAIGPIVPHPY